MAFYPKVVDIGSFVATVIVVARGIGAELLRGFGVLCIRKAFSNAAVQNWDLFVLDGSRDQALGLWCRVQNRAANSESLWLVR